MKKLILFELIFIFLATTFISDNPPGWYQQVLPVNDQINDIFFLDSLTGWIVTAGASSSSDTGYIIKTTNGGDNWQVQYNPIMNFNALQFLNSNTGYAGGGNGFGRFFKTINGGLNWNNIFSFGFITVTDLSFVNKDTGWVCSNDPIGGGIFKTTNGGFNWQQQLGASFSIKKLFFINSDTGWAGSDEANSKLYRTTNSGQVWDQQYSFSTSLGDIFFINGTTGFISGNFVPNAIRITTNGGFNWDSTSNSQGAIDIYFTSNLMGFTCANFSIVQKTTNGGLSWYRQTVPSGFYNSVYFPDSSRGWAGGTILIHTIDGGGPPVGVANNNEIPASYKLYQNYPNPFNPVTKIKYQISKRNYVIINIYNIQGKEINSLVSQVQSSGTYEVDFDGTNFSSGIYFYSLIIVGRIIDTKRMVLIK